MATRDVTAPTALTLKTVLRDYSTGTERLWNTGTEAFEAYSSGSIADYGITTTEGSPGSYDWTVPGELPSSAESEYKSKTYRIAGSNLATSDLPNIVYEDDFWWDGSTFAPPNPVASSIDYGLIQAASSGSVKLSAPYYVERPTSGTITYGFDVHTFNSSGAYADATGDITIKMRDGVDASLATAWSLTGPTKPATGIYRYAFSIPSTYTYSQFRLSAQATVAGVTGFDPRTISVSIAKVNTATGKIESSATVTVKVVHVDQS